VGLARNRCRRTRLGVVHPWNFLEVGIEVLKVSRKISQSKTALVTDVFILTWRLQYHGNFQDRHPLAHQLFWVRRPRWKDQDRAA